LLLWAYRIWLCGARLLLIAPHVMEPMCKPAPAAVLEPRETSRGSLERDPKKLLNFFDEDMFQLFDFERVLIDQMSPFEWDAL